MSSQNDDEAVQQKQTAESAIAELQRLLQQEQKKTAALTQEVGAAGQAMTANAEQHRALDEAQARAAALASELAGTRREIETQAAQSQEAVDEAVQQKKNKRPALAGQIQKRHCGGLLSQIARSASVKSVTNPWTAT
jgi:hypothetical protein